jgi:hypothetical protein
MTTITTLADIKSAKTSDLLALYNAHRKPIIKFRDRATAEQRVADLLQELSKNAPVQTAQSAPAAAPAQNPKTYLGIIRDHSGSMQSLRAPAMADFNALLAATRRAAAANNIETAASVYECDSGTPVERRRVNHLTPIGSISPMVSYRANGGTPLFKTVLQAIQDLKKVSDYNNPEVTFLVMATTDGQDTSGGASELAREIRELQNTDRWTFVFRVPRGYARDLCRLGIEPGNILEWDQTERGVQASSQANDQAFADFYTARTTGTKSTRTFYTSVANITEADVKKLGDISGEVQLFPVSAREEGSQIRDFVENRLSGTAMLKGAAFYQLVKTEDKIQDYKLIAIRDKESGQIFCGPEARDLIGLPRYGDARVRPDTAGKWQVFVQSTSVNRKVNAGTQIMYWPNVGKRFTEGKSAR